MGTLRDPSTINNVGTLGGATNPTTAQALPLERENQKAIRELVGTFGYEDLTISSGGITPTKAEVTVDTEAGASADDLTTIYLVSDGTTTLHDGMLLKLRAYDPARAVTVKHGSGTNQIQTVSGTDIVLGTDWELTLKLQSGVWKEIAGKPVADITGNAATATDLASGSVLSVAKGGTGVSTAAAALTNLGALDSAHATDPAAHVTLFAGKLGLDNYLHARDNKASGTPGGSSSAATWHTRDLNTLNTNNITGASLSSHKITLPAGDYYVRACAPCRMTSHTRLKVYNYTDSADILVGQNVYVDSSYGSGTPGPTVCGKFSLGAAKAIEIRMYTTNARANDGLGAAQSIGTEIYTEVEIWKL